MRVRSRGPLFCSGTQAIFAVVGADLSSTSVIGQSASVVAQACTAVDAVAVPVSPPANPATVPVQVSPGRVAGNFVIGHLARSLAGCAAAPAVVAGGSLLFERDTLSGATYYDPAEGVGCELMLPSGRRRSPLVCGFIHASTLRIGCRRRADSSRIRPGGASVFLRRIVRVRPKVAIRACECQPPL
jgi:hypothetical protein